MKHNKTKQEQYAAGLAVAKQQAKLLEQSGVAVIPIEVAASLLPVKPEWDK